MRDIVEIIGFAVAAGLGACFVAFMGGIGLGAGLAMAGWPPKRARAPKIRITEEAA